MLCNAIIEKEITRAHTVKLSTSSLTDALPIGESISWKDRSIASNVYVSNVRI